MDKAGSGLHHPRMASTKKKKKKAASRKAPKRKPSPVRRPKAKARKVARPARRSQPRPKKTATKKTVKRKAARRKTPPMPSAKALLARLEIVVGAHAGLVLEGEEKETFANEVPDLDAIVDTHPEHGELMTYCAYAYRKLGRFEDALHAAERALATARSWRHLTAKATVLRAKGEADGAIELFDEAAQLDLDDTSALMEGARTLGEANRFRDAAEWFGRVLERDPEYTEALLWREYSAFSDSRSPEHVARVKRVLEEDPENGLARRLLAFMA
jgi:tetratricopeptide (TPR) repeat protein